MSKKTLGLLIFLIAISVVLVIVAIIPRGAPIVPKPAITPTPTPPIHSSLIISPNPLVLPASGFGQASIMIDTGGNQITTVQLELTYDPAAITNVDITPGAFLTNATSPLKKIDAQIGRISYDLALPFSQDPVKGIGEVAKLTFYKKVGAPATITQTPISFLPRTLVTNIGVNTSVLKSTTGTVVILSTAPTASTAPTLQKAGAVSPTTAVAK